MYLTDVVSFLWLNVVGAGVVVLVCSVAYLKAGVRGRGE
jgi:hypothetical protein